VFNGLYEFCQLSVSGSVEGAVNEVEQPSYRHVAHGVAANSSVDIHGRHSTKAPTIKNAVQQSNITVQATSTHEQYHGTTNGKPNDPMSQVMQIITKSSKNGLFTKTEKSLLINGIKYFCKNLNLSS
jgi:hypothetical protein